MVSGSTQNNCLPEEFVFSTCHIHIGQDHVQSNMELALDNQCGEPDSTVIIVLQIFTMTTSHQTSILNYRIVTKIPPNQDVTEGTSAQRQDDC